MIKNELVSIYMPTHNRVELAIRAVESVLNQTYNNLELIVVDDGSCDDTYSKLNGIDDRRLVLIRNERASGACYSRNRAIKKAQGKYITGIDDDDYFHPSRIEKLLKSFDEKYSFVFDSAIQDNKGFYKSEEVSEKIVNLREILSSNIGNQVFTLTERVLSVGGFDVSLPSSQDYDLWTRLIIEYGDAKKINSATYYFDITHENKRISTSKKAINGAEMYYEKYKDLMSNYNKSNQIKRMSYYGKYAKFSGAVLLAKQLGIIEMAKCYMRAFYVRNR